MLEFKHVSFQYEQDLDLILEDLSFTIQDQEFVSIIGVSGCGKSTILKLASHLLIPSNGEILIRDESVEKLDSAAGYMPQKDLLLPWRTIEKNLWLPMEIHHFSKEEMRQRSSEALADVGLLDYKDKYPKDLSGGMRQRVSFARTLLTDTDLMLLDEPFSALDSLTRMSMQEWLLQQWKRHSKTILFITHDVEEALFLSSKIFVVTDRPIHTLQEIQIPAGYPRERELLDDPAFVALKDELLLELRKQVKI